MVFHSLGKAAGWMAKSPYVWLSGLWAAVVPLIAWYLYESFGGAMVTILVAMALMLVFPALIAGTYGVVAEDESSLCVFRRYAIHGYFRQLLSSILMFLIAWFLLQFVFYVLLAFGFEIVTSAQMATFVFIPVMFFCYFADVIAVVNKKHAFASVKNSFLLVLNGSLSVVIFHLVNFVLMIMVSVVGSVVFAAFTMDTFLPLASMTETELLSMTYDEFLVIVSTSEVVFAGFAALAMCVVFFVPLFTLYKACYFVTTSALALSDISKDPVGMYDEKGRWYKYS
ncbi:MAG: hypothetical protein LBH02_01125 [Methanocalculaceae archaeon]|jgi:hypothetical protein|nr:hypothetical protein [Methanocalculaceae archaeon]